MTAPGRFLRHVILTSGDVRDIHASDVSDELVAYCRRLLDDAVAGEATGRSVEIEPLPGVRMSAHATRRNVLLSFRWQESRILTVGIATHSRGGASLWRLLVETAQTPVVPPDCPAEPWVAARLERGAVLLSPDALMVLADLERCLGWAWIGRVEARRGWRKP